MNTIQSNFIISLYIKPIQTPHSPINQVGHQTPFIEKTHLSPFSPCDLLTLLINLPRNNLHPLPLRILLHTAPQLLPIHTSRTIHRVPSRQTFRAHRPCGRVVCRRVRGARGLRLALGGGGEDAEAHFDARWCRFGLSGGMCVVCG